MQTHSFILGTIDSYCAWVWYPLTPFPRHSAFTLVILFHTGVKLCHHLRDICLCCCNSVEKDPDPKRCKPSQFGDIVKENPLACLPTLSPMAVQFRDWDLHMLYANEDLCGLFDSTLQRLLNLNSSRLLCFSTVGFHTWTVRKRFLHTYIHAVFHFIVELSVYLTCIRDVCSDVILLNNKVKYCIDLNVWKSFITSLDLLVFPAFCQDQARWSGDCSASHLNC